MSPGPEPNSTDAFGNFLAACEWFGISYQWPKMKAQNSLAKS